MTKRKSSIAKKKKKRNDDKKAKSRKLTNEGCIPGEASDIRCEFVAIYYIRCDSEAEAVAQNAARTGVTLVGVGIH